MKSKDFPELISIDLNTNLYLQVLYSKSFSIIDFYIFNFDYLKFEKQ